MVSSIISIKAALISTGIAAMSLFLKSCVPIAVDFSVSRFPILWGFFLSWLKPPYLLVVINVIIIIIVASSRYYRSIGDHDCEKYEIFHGSEYMTQIEPIVIQTPPRRLEVKDVDLVAEIDFVPTIPPMDLDVEVERSEQRQEAATMVGEDEISGLINSGDDFAVLTSQWNQVPSMIGDSENLPPHEKPLASARFGHRKPVKASPKGGIKKKALRVVKPKRHETLENTFKMITDEKSTPLTSQYRRPDTFGLNAGEVKAALRKSETFRDVTNYHQSPTVTPPVKMKKEMSPSREELNRRIEAFIKKCKEERLKSVRLDKEMVLDARF